MSILSNLNHRLQKRISEGSLRNLSVKNNLIDFCSNDYLGFARSRELDEAITNSPYYGNGGIGSTGSRLISGNPSFAEDLENYIAKFHKAEAGLIFNSGYDANVGLFSSIAKKGDTILYDELIHASVHDGMRMGIAYTHAFRHNDITHLEEKLKTAQGSIFIAVESIYSMDGDEAPLKEMAALAEKYSAALLVDEAHATGIYGEKGEGKVVELGLQDKVFARIHTFGKALGCHGGIVIGDEMLRNYLINFARSFIYTTALPMHSLITIKCAYELLQTDYYKQHKQKLQRNIELFKRLLLSSADNYQIVPSPLGEGQDEGIKAINFIVSSSPIQAIIIEGNEKVKSLALSIQEKGYDARAILSPTVPKGKERIRICLHSFNSEKEIKELVALIHL